MNSKHSMTFFPPHKAPYLGKCLLFHCGVDVRVVLPSWTDTANGTFQIFWDAYSTKQSQSIKLDYIQLSFPVLQHQPIMFNVRFQPMSGYVGSSRCFFLTESFQKFITKHYLPLDFAFFRVVVSAETGISMFSGSPPSSSNACKSGNNKNYITYWDTHNLAPWPGFRLEANFYSNNYLQ